MSGTLLLQGNRADLHVLHDAGPAVCLASVAGAIGELVELRLLDQAEGPPQGPREGAAPPPGDGVPPADAQAAVSTVARLAAALEPTGHPILQVCYEICGPQLARQCS